MKIGIDINNKTISAVFLKENNVPKFIKESIYNVKRDTNRTIMEKLISMINFSTESRIKGIGLSLPSKIDEKRGVVFDVMKIPYWKGNGIKKILEEEFNTRIWINNEVNCSILAERHLGMYKGFSNILCINIDYNISTGLIIDGKLFIDEGHPFDLAKCLSIPSYDFIRVYRESFMRTIDELNYICSQFEKGKSSYNDEEILNELGTLLGRLISILFRNHKFDAVLLGGSLGKVYARYMHFTNTCLEKHVDKHALLKLIISPSEIEYSKALGAALLINNAS